jgi:geranylgeranylglycerol-phosphate geranylgeranyltransferase
VTDRYKVYAYTEIIRPVNCLMMVLAVYAASVVGERTLTVPDSKLLAGFVTAFMLTGFAMVVNDIFDLKTDLLNEPSRPIPSGRLTIGEARSYAFFLAASGVAFAAYDGWITLALASLSVVISYAYSFKLKLGGLLGNLAVSYNVGLPFLYGGLITSGLRPVLAVFFILAFLSNTGREIVKGIAETEGDRLRGAQTVAIRYGEKAASIAASLFSLVAVALSPLPVIVGGISLSGYLPPITVTDVLFVYLAVKLLASSGNASSVKREYKFPMLLAILSFITGALF